MPTSKTDISPDYDDETASGLTPMHKQNVDEEQLDERLTEDHLHDDSMLREYKDMADPDIAEKTDGSD
jgi:hypothetical protein